MKTKNEVVELPEAVAHIYRSDLEKFKTSETFAQCFSVKVGCYEETSVELYTADQMHAHAAAVTASRDAEIADLYEAAQQDQIEKAVLRDEIAAQAERIKVLLEQLKNVK